MLKNYISLFSFALMLRYLLSISLLLTLFACKQKSGNNFKNINLESNQIIVDLKEGVPPTELMGALKTYGFKALECIDTTKNIWIYSYNEQKVHREKLEKYLEKSIKTDHNK